VRAATVRHILDFTEPVQPAGHLVTRTATTDSQKNILPANGVIGVAEERFTKNTGRIGLPGQADKGQ